MGEVGGKRELRRLLGVLRRGAGHDGEREDLGPLRAQALLVLARGLVGEVRPCVARLTHDAVAGEWHLREHEVEERLAVGLEGDLAAGDEYVAEVHEALHACHAKVRVALSGEGRGEVEVNARELAGREELADAHPGAGDHHHVWEAALADALGCVCHADGLGVHGDEEHVRLAARRLDGERPLPAAEVEADLAVAPGLRTGADAAPAGLGPPAAPALRRELNGVRVAFEALLEDEVLGKPRVKGVGHGFSVS